MNLLLNRLDEQQRRWYLAVESQRLGHGADRSLFEITGVTRRGSAAAMRNCPGAVHIRTGLHRARGETTHAVQRSHVPTRDRLRNSRGLKRTGTGQRFLEGFEALRHLRRGGAPGAGHLVRGPAVHARVRAVLTVVHALGYGLRRD